MGMGRTRGGVVGPAVSEGGGVAGGEVDLDLDLDLDLFRLLEKLRSVGLMLSESLLESLEFWDL